MPSSIVWAWLELSIDAVIRVDELDYLFEVDEPLASPSELAIDDVSREIGDRVAARVADGSTLQMGIGAVPDATLTAMSRAKKLLQHLGSPPRIPTA